MDKEVAKQYVEKVYALEEAIKDLFQIEDKFDDEEVCKRALAASGEFLNTMYFDVLYNTAYKQYPELDRTGHSEKYPPKT